MIFPIPNNTLLIHLLTVTLTYLIFLQNISSYSVKKFYNPENHTYTHNGTFFRTHAYEDKIYRSSPTPPHRERAELVPEDGVDAREVRHELRVRQGLPRQGSPVCFLSTYIVTETKRKTTRVAPLSTPWQRWAVLANAAHQATILLSTIVS